MTEEQLCTELVDLDLDDHDTPKGERWAPLGANDSDKLDHCIMQEEHGGLSEAERLHHLEEEQEHLNNSLLALTTHFAQVQFRLKQIVDAPPENKEQLLKELEEFAFRGIPDMRVPHMSDRWEEGEEEEGVREESHGCYQERGKAEEGLEEKMVVQRARQKELICQLKAQLEDLETYAYVTGEAGPPQSLLLHRQRLLIDQLKGKLNLNVDDMDKLTEDDLKSQVDQAVSQLVNPLKMKEQLVTQLKTQIVDLERFISFLQGEATSPGPLGNEQCTCDCPVHGSSHFTFHKSHSKGVGRGKGGASSRGGAGMGDGRKGSKFNGLREQEAEEIHSRTIDIMKKMLTLLQMFAVSQFGCGSEHFRRNSLKKTTKGNHWGDLRANLELAVSRVAELAATQELPVDSDYTSDSDDSPVVMCQEKLTTTVRKELAIAIRDLLEHGLSPTSQSRSLVPFVGCFPARSGNIRQSFHAWELIIRYYELKKGDQYNATPARRLSQSFNLDIIGGTAITSKQMLLSTIGNILATHSKYKRSYDSHFKAFVCAALNVKKLVPWLRLIISCQPLVEKMYQPWSYVGKTGFEDALKSLEKLNKFHFDLPVDLAIRQFQNIKDAFQ